ncbi:MAG: 23S rRNA (pseudouridine(1915)-N(3))-methyltransferase RlmH [Burkholderiales bacterium]
MKLVVAAVGERMPGWVDEAFADYARRFPRKARIELAEVRPEKRAATRTPAQAMVAEGQRLAAALPAGALRVALDERGRDLTTAGLARLLALWLGGGRDVGFLIGGPDGLDPALRARADLVLRLSSLTLPHALVRVLLAEQLYRALALLDNHPYHRR